MAEITAEELRNLKSAKQKRPGPKTGQGRYPGDDALCIEMARRIQSAQAKNIWDAAGQVVPKAEGNNVEPASKQRRLFNHFKRHGDYWDARLSVQAFVARAAEQHGELMQAMQRDIRNPLAIDPLSTGPDRGPQGLVPTQSLILSELQRISSILELILSELRD
jgi:hypothetical protein